MKSEINSDFCPARSSEFGVVAGRARVKRHDFPAALGPSLARKAEQTGRAAFNQFLTDLANDVAGRPNHGVLGRCGRGGLRRRIVHGTTGRKGAGDAITSIDHRTVRHSTHYELRIHHFGFGGRPYPMGVGTPRMSATEPRDEFEVLKFWKS